MADDNDGRHKDAKRDEHRPQTGGHGWSYDGITSYEASGSGDNLEIERARAVQTKPRTKDDEGGWRAVWLNPDNRVCPADGGLPDFIGSDWHDFERVGVVSDYRDAPTEGLVYAETSDDEGTEPRWYWVRMSKRFVVDSVGGPRSSPHPDRPDAESRPVDLHVYLDDEIGDETQQVLAEDVAETLDGHSGVDHVHNCVEVRNSEDDE